MEKEKEGGVEKKERDCRREEKGETKEKGRKERKKEEDG